METNARYWPWVQTKVTFSKMESEPQNLVSHMCFKSILNILYDPYHEKFIPNSTFARRSSVIDKVERALLKSISMLLFRNEKNKRAEKAAHCVVNCRESSVSQCLPHTNILAAASKCCRKTCCFVRMWLGHFVGKNEQTALVNPFFI